LFTPNRSDSTLVKVIVEQIEHNGRTGGFLATSGHGRDPVFNQLVDNAAAAP
jgi:hypothetical protein